MHRAGTMALLTLGLLGCGDAARDRASEAVTKIGGQVEYDDADSGVVRRVVFDDKSRVGGGDMVMLKEFPQLRELRMGGSQVDDEGVSGLAGLKQLETLDLSRTKVGDAGLAGLKGLARLRSLDLKGTGGHRRRIGPPLGPPPCSRSST